jgi:hypothetical protein
VFHSTLFNFSSQHGRRGNKRCEEKIRAHQAITYDLKIYPSYNPLSGHKIILLSMEGMKGVKAGKDE